MQTSFNVILPMQDGSVFKHSYLSNPPDLIELILVHIIALQQPVVLIDHYVQSVVVSIRNIQIPAFSHLTQVELSKMNESINGHISDSHQAGLHKQFEIRMT